MSQELTLDRAAVKGKVEKTPEGYLKIDAVVTRPGVFTYMVDGKPHRRYCPPEVVYDSNALETLKLKPVVAGHPYTEPGQMIHADNFRKLAAGWTGENIRRHEGDIMASFLVTAADAIKRVESKELKELSCGYLTEIDWTPGITPEGEKYDSKQTKRIYNHLSLEKSGRVGNAIIALDSGLDADGVSYEITNDNDITTEVQSMATITRGGVSYEVPDNFVPVYQGMQSDLDAAETRETELSAKVSELQATADNLTADNGKLKTELDSASGADEEAIKTQAKELAALYAVASEAGLDAKDYAEKSAAEIKRAICEKKQPEVSLDGKDEAYINAAFDYVSKLKAQGRAATTKVVPSLDKAEDKAEAARSGMINRLTGREDK